MPMNPIVPIAGLGILLMMMGGKKAKAATLSPVGGGTRGPWLEPVPLPESDADKDLIARTICECWSKQAEQGLYLEGPQLLDCLAETMHPEVPWPPQEGDHETVFQAWQIFVDLVGAWSSLSADEKAAACAELGAIGDIAQPPQEPEPEHPTDFAPVDQGGNDPGELLDDLISDVPMPGRFYRIKSGDTMAQLARRALNAVIPGSGEEGGARLDYIYCMSSGAGWNLAMYGSTRTTQIYPELYAINGLTLAVAFLPYHENPITAVMESRPPNRGADHQGDKIQGVGNDYGMIWMPPVDPQVLANEGEPTCGAVNWSDGSSSIDPPPEFFALVGA